MKKPMTTVQFKGTPEQKAKLDAVIEQYKGKDGAMMPVLQAAQEIYGYLPLEVQHEIAEGLGKPFSEVYGVVTFYAMFLLNPKGEHPVNVCLGTACYVKGSGKIMEKLQEVLGIPAGGITEDLKFSLDATRCIGACGLAPVMTVGDDVYGRLEPKMVEGIIAKYR
ncbi:MAG: NAD(P)H-dependent oxidoreductase subunit E [Clostridia bacterium]|nr:NAD(P)H-dependent oxidoreductase subunit E [Clostridia bacterium]